MLQDVFAIWRKLGLKSRGWIGYNQNWIFVRKTEQFIKLDKSRVFVQRQIWIVNYYIRKSQ